MDATQLLVTLIGLGLIAFVAWFFFGASPGAAILPATAPPHREEQQLHDEQRNAGK
jgi:plastocyanin domain-containing protein